MNVLVTGGAGYIGSFCVAELVRAGHHPVVLDRRPVTALLPSGVPTVLADIRDREAVERAIRDHEVLAVLHLAAEKSVADAMHAPGPHLENNLGGSLSLFEAMRITGVTKVVFSSSAAVYGTPTSLPIREDAPLMPENPYGAAKAMVEEVLRWYHQGHGFDSVSLRYFNAAGAADDGSMGEDWTDAPNLIPRVMSAAYGVSGPVEVFGTDHPTPDGTAIRDYIHVIDLARAHVLALDVLSGRGGAQAVNLGTGRGSSVREVLDAASAACGRPVPHDEVERRPGDPSVSYAATSEAERLLGWRAQRDLADIMRTEIRWRERSPLR